MKKFFVSHSSKDSKIVDSFVKNILRLGMNIEEKQIFCTSVDGSGITTGEKWRDAICGEITKAKVILLLITPNYKQSEICLNEMGAAWITNAKVIPLIAGNITHKGVGVVVDTKQVARFDDINELDNLQEALMAACPEYRDKFNVPNWNSCKRKYIEDINNIIKKNPFPSALSQDEIQNILNDKEELENEYDNLRLKNVQLEKMIEELKMCKDKSEVMDVEKKYDDSNIEDKFEDLVIEAKANISKVSLAVGVFIYNDYAKKDLHVNFECYIKDIEEAKARHWIEEDDESGFKPLYEKKEMKNIIESLDELRSFIDGLSDDDYEKLENKYNCTLDVNDLDFWEKVIKVNLSSARY